MLSHIFNADGKILQRIRQNDRTVLGELFIANRAAVTRYIKRNGGTPDDAEDMLQEAIIVLWQKACTDGFTLTARISTFLFSVARNKWLAELRRRRNQATPMETLPEKGNEADNLQSMIDEEDGARLKDALEKLAEICREILRFYYFEQRNMANIAELTGLANANVAKAKKYQCIKALQKQMHIAYNENSKRN